MDYRQLARDFITKAANPQTIAGDDRRHDALLGLLDGIAQGRITQGQGLIAELLLKEPADYKKYADIDSDLVRKLFSSGICSEGVELEKNKWTGRAP